MADRACDARLIAVCPIDQLLESGRITVLLRSGQRCLVLNVDGRMYAVSAICTHRKLSLENARLENGQLVCPWHKARFDPATGSGTPPAPCALPTYPVVVTDGIVYLLEKDGTP